METTEGEAEIWDQEWGTVDLLFYFLLAPAKSFTLGISFKDLNIVGQQFKGFS